MKTGLWAFFLLLVAVTTAGAQLDRQSRVTPQLAGIVPLPFRSFAQEVIATDALRSADQADALSEARRLVARRPMPAEHLHTLALAEARNGQSETSLTILQTAGRRGWRDPAVQETMLRLALVNSDTGAAARRYAALSANPQTPEALLRELGEAALASEQSRADFAAILAPARKWHSLFLSRSARTLPPAIADDVIAKALAREADFRCPDLRQAERILADRLNASGTATAGWIGQHC